jgi:citrate synthase
MDDSMKREIRDLLNARGVLDKRSGGWLAGQGVFSHGHDLLKDLLPSHSYFHVMVLNALGFLPDDKLCAWLEAIFICLSWPDPRIWCNGIGSLAGSSETTALAATAAGMLASDSHMYGPFTLFKGVEFIQDAKIEIDGGVSLEGFIESKIKRSGGKVHLMGFARPIAKGDERVEAMLSYSKSLNFEIGGHLQLALEMEQYLIKNHDESMNIGGYISAFLSDQNLTPEQVYLLFPSMVNSGVTACYIEDLNKPDDSFLPLTCEDIEYTGPALRELPKGFKSQT